jgi:hypothetical protein
MIPSLAQDSQIPIHRYGGWRSAANTQQVVGAPPGDFQGRRRPATLLKRFCGSGSL